MSVESDIYALLGPLVSGECYPRETPDTFAYPCIVWQIVGGQRGWYVDNSMPSHKHARLQVMCFAKTVLEVDPLSRLIEATFSASAMIVRPYGGFTATNAPKLGIFGNRQDFSIWYPD